MSAPESTSDTMGDGLGARLRGRVLSQGSLIFSGFAAAQALSFLRNSIIGHTLSRDDFGIAATITLTIQLVETLSDLGADRQIVQDKIGETEKFVSNAHGLLVCRGLLLAALILVTGPLLTHYFDIPEALFAFEIAALVPVIKGAVHLDFRVAQRRLNNRPQVAIELLPQVFALALTVPVLAYVQNFAVAAYLAIAQAIMMVAVSHIVARQPYRIGFDTDLWRKQLRFGLPILASALPLVAVYHGDRIVIGRLYDMSAVGAYSAALMLTMVPALLVSRVAHALMLPVFSEKVRDGHSMRRAFAGMTEGIAMLAACFAMVFGIIGGDILVIAFGEAYRGLHALVSAFACMWAIRMIQSVPGMALMAHGDTRPFAIAGFVRAMALPCVFVAATAGYGLAVLAALGAVFELASLTYITLRLDLAEPGLARVFRKRVLIVIPALIAPMIVLHAVNPDSVSERVGIAILMTGLLVFAGALSLPAIRRTFRRATSDLASWRVPVRS